MGWGWGYIYIYPDAACKPRPREPPVTTTTFPLTEKMLSKSFSATWASASVVEGMVLLGGKGSGIERFCRW